MSISINIESVVIIGSGPAAYSAAVYCSSMSPIILAGDYNRTSQYPGGQLTTTTDVDNYPGFPLGIQGPDLVNLFEDHAKEHARRQEVWVNSISKEEEYFIIKTSSRNFMAKSVIVATGSVANKLEVPGSNELWQKGISACAICDGWTMGGKVVVVVGGGDTAMEEVQYLSKIGSKVILIHRSNKFRARPDLLKRIRELENVQVIEWTVLVEVKGAQSLEKVVVKNVQTEKIEEIEAQGLFFAIGHTPSTKFLKDIQEETGICILGEGGYIKTDKRTMSTEIEGLYAIGDVQDNRYRQAITAAYSGMVAGTSVTEWLKK